jgi:hypothetical protein
MTNPDMWAPVRNRQWILLSFAAATTLVHFQIIANGIDVF